MASEYLLVREERGAGAVGGSTSQWVVYGQVLKEQPNIFGEMQSYVAKETPLFRYAHRQSAMDAAEFLGMCSDTPWGVIE